jgi:hypothetical protein
MRIGKLNAILKAAHKNEAAARGMHGQQLEDELMSSYRRQRGREWFFMFKPQSVTARLTFGVIIIAALGFGACSMPTETEVPMGKQVSIGYDAGDGNEFTYDFSFDLTQEKLDRLKAMPGVEDVSISESIDGGQRRVDVVLWGDELASEQAMQYIQQELGTPENALVEIRELSGTVHESWASKIGREFFHIELDGDLSDEELKAQIIAQLEADGFEATDVNVFSQDGQKSIFISGSQDAPDGVSEIQDEMVFEWVSEEEVGGDDGSEDQ